MIGKWMEDTEHDSQTILKQYKVSALYKNNFYISGCVAIPKILSVDSLASNYTYYKIK